MARVRPHVPPTHPGETLLEEFLAPLGMTQTELAERLGVSYPRVNELIHRKRGILRALHCGSNDRWAWRLSSGSTFNLLGTFISSGARESRRRAQG